MRTTLAAAIATVAVAALSAGTPAAALTVPSKASASAAPCTAAGLVIWVPDGLGNGAAGSIYYKLQFTNLSGRACTMSGFPTITAVSLSGQRIGKPAKPEPGQKPRLVKLSKGGSATAQLRIVDAGAITPTACQPTMAAGLSVSPPGQSASRPVPLPFEACAKGASVLSVRALKPLK
jgi:uncharacterized protein DUF4232